MAKLIVRRNSGWAFAAGCATMAAAALVWQVFGAAPAAYAQIPDSGAQRNEMIRELQLSNEKLTEIAGLLRDIRDTQAAPKKTDAPRPTSRP